MGGRTIAACACALALPAPGAFAQERPDPDSPAGVEYELPLEGARRDAAGGVKSGAEKKGTGRGGNAKAPLFGQGISRPGASDQEDTAGGAGAAGSEGGSGGSRGTGGSGGGANPAEPTAPARLAATSADDGGDKTVVVGGIAAGVLLCGGLLGLFLRRGFGRSETS